MVTRFQTLLQELKLTAAEFAGRIGVQRSSMSHVMSGRNKPSIDFLEKILRSFPEVNADWLITGNGHWKIDRAELNDTRVPATTKGDNIPQSGKLSEGNDALADDVPGNLEFKDEPARLHERPVRQIIIVYDDDTFSLLVPRRTNS
jgi:transcriptional regulator with XRE-family HTH domain